MDNGSPEGYRMTELGALPEEWEVVRLSDCVDIRLRTYPNSPAALNVIHAHAKCNNAR